MEKADILVVGAGIVGLATAFKVQQRLPGRKVVVLEKESGPAKHQSGRNSGVLHTGVYYKPGSLKAQNCRAGKKAMEDFCREHGIAYEICGKIIVATRDAERPALHEIMRRGMANGVKCSLKTREQFKEIEPEAEGVEAIHVPEAGIADFPAVCAKLVELIRAAGNEVRFGTAVSAASVSPEGFVVGTSMGSLLAGFVVNCAGLQCDKVAEMFGEKPLARIVPFKGEYYEVLPIAQRLCRNLIYPVPDPAFPFLGVHFTRMIHGGVECGPNAVPALGREAYSRGEGSLSQFFEILKYSGTRSLFSKHWKMGMGEIHRSLSKKAFVKALRRLVPAVQPEHLVPAACGIRAQAVFPDGDIVQDFLLQEGPRAVHVLNAPSPAATSALNVGDLIAYKVEDQLA